MRTLALGKRGSAFYRSLSTVLCFFGDVVFHHESERSPEEWLRWVAEEGIDHVLMPNPYGNPTRLACYRAFREAGVSVVASDRGALPDSWFFDHGFNADSPSYGSDAWDQPLGDADREAARAYIASLRASNEALEAQGRRTPAEALRSRLEVGRRRLLFVPLQRPGDTVVRHFSGPVNGMQGFLDFVGRVAAGLGDEWALRAKKHPLEVDHPPLPAGVEWAPDDAHVHDLLEASDAVLVLNSGVGLLSLCFGKPTLHVGDAFYAGLAQRVATAEESLEALRPPTPPDRERVERLVHHLTKKVYSFASFDTEVKREEHALRRITRHLEFRELRILGESFDVSGDRVLVVSPVLPSGIYRGSQSRVDMVIRAMIADGKRVSLAVLNRSRRRPSAEVVKELRESHPELERIEVVRHFAITPHPVAWAKKYGAKLGDLLTLGTHRIANLDSCPPVFQRAVTQMVDEIRPHALWVNYAKLGPCVPRAFDGLKVIDTHDYQTQFLIEDQTRNRKRLHVNRHLYGLSERFELRRFDRIVAINPGERDVFRRIAPGREVVFIPAFSRASDESATLEHDALFVASMSNFNVKGLKWFHDRVLPRIREHRADFELTVVGNIAKCGEVIDAGLRHVNLVGVVPELGPWYGASRCVIAPILGGAGMKIKVVEALAHGKAIIATSKALEGIGAKHEEHLLVGDDPGAFADAVVSVLDDSDLRTRLERGARELHQRDHSPEAIVEPLRRALRR